MNLTNTIIKRLGHEKWPRDPHLEHIILSKERKKVIATQHALSRDPNNPICLYSSSNSISALNSEYTELCSPCPPRSAPRQRPSGIRRWGRTINQKMVRTGAGCMPSSRSGHGLDSIVVKRDMSAGWTWQARCTIAIKYSNHVDPLPVRSVLGSRGLTGPVNRGTEYIEAPAGGKVCFPFSGTRAAGSGL